MAIKHAAQRFGIDAQKITVFTDTQDALHRIKNDKEGPGKAFARIAYSTSPAGSSLINHIYRLETA
jgi:hypothetical protein